MKHLYVSIFLSIAISLLLTACGPGQLFGPQPTLPPTLTLTPSPTPLPTSTPLPTATLEPTNTPEPTLTPTSSVPTYSQITSTYPANANLCRTDAEITGGDDNGLMLSGTISMQNMKFVYKCYGTKLTAKVEITLGGITYATGTKLTVDKDLNWIEVSSWN